MNIMVFTIKGLVSDGTLPASAKTDLANNITTPGSTVRAALDAAGLGQGASDADIAGFVTSTSSATGAAVASVVSGAAVDRGQGLTSKLDIGAGNAVVTVLGDSTGNETHEWVYKTVQDVAAKHPRTRVEYKLWSDASQSYGATQVLQEGGLPAPAPVKTRQVEDTFTRTVADVRGSTPDKGTAWNGSFSSSTGAYSANGTVATANVDTGGELFSRGTTTGEHHAKVTFTARTDLATAKPVRLIAKWVDSNNHLYINGNLGAAGNAFTLNQRVGGVLSTLATWATSPVPANTASQTITLELLTEGTTVRGIVNGVEVTGTMTQANVTALSAANGVGFMTQVLGATIDNVSLDVTAPASQTVTTIHDTFNRTSAELRGTYPDTAGTAWWGASNSAGVYSTDGSHAVSTGGSGVLISDGETRGAQTLSATFTTSTEATHNGKWIRLYGKYLSDNDNIYLSMNVGGYWSVQKRINGAVTTVVGWGTPPVTQGSASVTFGASLTVNGTNVSATINGVTVTGTITQAEADHLAPATQAAFGAQVPGSKIDVVKLDVVPDRTAEQTLTVYNGSHPGSIFQYQADRLDKMVPVTPDLFLLSSCHNYGAMVPDDYTATLKSFTGLLRRTHPSAGIVLTSQNPQKAPATNKNAHLLRLTKIRPFAEAHGYGYIPASEAFRSRADGGAPLVDADGIHPTPDGSTLWASTAIGYLDALSLAP